MRRFFSTKTVVRLPALPRRLAFLAMMALMVSGLFLAPFFASEMVRTRLNEAVQQAVMLAQLSDMVSLEGRRAATASQALPVVGFHVHTAEAATPSQSWLVLSPAPRAAKRNFNMAETHFVDVLSLAWWIVTCPPDTVFGVRNAGLSDAVAVTALTTTGLFALNIYDALWRIFSALLVATFVLVVITHYAARRLTMTGLDDELKDGATLDAVAVQG